MTAETLEALRECTSEKTRLADKIDRLYSGDKGTSSKDDGRRKEGLTSKKTTTT